MYAACLLLGYFAGSLNPAAWIAARKGVDIRKRGTKNLGATNAMLNFGKGTGLFVMIFDIAKAYLVFKLAQSLFPEHPIAGLLAGSSAVAGHVFPFYLRFRGGKGFAALGGLILAYDPEIFLLLLGSGVALMLITNVSLTLQLSALLFFPLLAGLQSHSIAVYFVCQTVCLLVMYSHRENIARAIHGEDVKVREFIREHLTK